MLKRSEEEPPGTTEKERAKGRKQAGTLAKAGLGGEGVIIGRGNRGVAGYHARLDMTNQTTSKERTGKEK